MSAICPKLKVAFVHIPKNAGISISRSLGLPATGHGTLSQLLKGKPLPKSYYVFSVARNPWDRLVAAYLYFKSGAHGTRVDKRVQKILAPYHTFSEFLAELDEILPVLNAVCTHFLPQIHFHDYRINYVARFENLESDWIYICSVLGIGDVPLRRDNMTAQAHYSTYYSTPAEVAKVGIVYYIDCQTYGYSYDSL